MLKRVYTYLIIACGAAGLFAQNPFESTGGDTFPKMPDLVLPDTLAAEIPDTSMLALPDSVIADTMAVDSLAKTQKSDLDTTIYYDARSIYTDVDSRTTELTGDAIIKYGGMTLKAEKITLDWKNYLMTAESVADTQWVYTDSTHSDSVIHVEYIGKPELNEGGSPYVGDKMVYNYKTEKGLVVRGRTELEGGKYLGQQIKRVNSDVFHISNSSYTTCELDTNPHFHFESQKLKMVMKDKVIAKPVVMYMGHIPILALPFAVFPIKSGRQSGILTPTYSESSTEGRSLRNLGYYWAPSDYFDAKLGVDYFEKAGFLFRGSSNYNVRYLLNGSMSGSYTHKEVNGTKTRRWDMRVSHKQDISPSSRFSVSGYFVSDKDYYKDYSTNLSTRLTREMRSNATYTKSWSKQKLSLSVNMSRVHDLQDDVVQETLPQVSFRKGQTQIFKPKKKSSRSSGGSSRRDSHWYESLYFSYNSNLINKSREYLSYTTDDTTKEVDETRNMSHDFNFSLNSPKKFFGWLSLNQNLNVSEDWFDQEKTYSWDVESESIDPDTTHGFAARHTFDYRASANTKLYGMFAPPIGDLQAIRHVVTPSISFTYQPDFSDPQWGYYEEIETDDGVEKRDKFSGTPSTGRKSVSLSVQNLFQMKRGEGEKEKKFDLFTMNFSSGYNFEAEKNKLSDLSTSWNANPMKNFSLSASTSHSFYKWISEPTTSSPTYGYKSNNYLFEDGGWKSGDFMRMTNLRLNFSLRLQGKKDKGGKDDEERPFENTLNEEEPDPLLEEENLSVLEEDLLRRGNRFENEMAMNSLSIPWQASLNFSFSNNKSNPLNPTKRYYMGIRGAEINLTRNWRIGYTAQYDLEKKQIASHSFTFHRDLHCWEGRVDWVPSGSAKRIYVIINIKARVLQDLKIEKRGGASSMLGY